MYDISYKNLRKGYIFYIPFLLIGLFFLGIFVTFLIGDINKEYDSKTKAYKIIDNCVYDDGSHVCSPIYYYRVNGANYQCDSGISSSMSVDHSKDIVYYDSLDPSFCSTEYDSGVDLGIYLFLFLPLIFVIFAVYQISKIGKRIKKVKHLAKYGTLFKGIKYTLSPTGMSVNGIQVLAPTIDFTLPSGSTITLVGDPRHDGRAYDADGLVDLLIDLDNPDNYYIDFEINHKQ